VKYTVRVTGQRVVLSQACPLQAGKLPFLNDRLFSALNPLLQETLLFPIISIFFAFCQEKTVEIGKKTRLR